MLAFLPAIAPVALIILIGYIAHKLLHDIETKSLSQITVYILAPALVADSLYKTDVSIRIITGLLIGFVVTSSVIYMLAKLCGRMMKLSPNLKTSLVATSLFPNNGNLGLSVITFAFGEIGLERAVIYLIASSILTFGLGPSLLAGNGLGYGLRLTWKLPLFWAIVLGLTWRLLGLSLPFNLQKGIEILGQAAIPVALIILGMQLAVTAFTLKKNELIGVFLRLIVAPAIALAMGYLLKLEAIDLQVLVLQSAMPTAVNTVVLVSEFGGDIPWTARAIVVSTLASFFTLPVWLLIVNSI